MIIGGKLKKNNFYFGEEMSKQISLTQGKFTIVDDWNYEWLNQWNWCVADCGSWEYAKRIENGKTVYMHRLIMGLSFNDNRQVDHINRNGLDNRENNFRICTNQQNAFNQKSKGMSSKYKGVGWGKRENKWRARIVINGKDTYLGYFENELDAAAAYDFAALKYFGEFAFTNFEISLAA